MTPFKLSADVYQWAVTLQNRLTEIVRGHTAALNALIRDKSSGAGRIEPGTAAMGEFQKASDDLLDEEKSVRMIVLPLASLKLDDNPGLAAHLAGLTPGLKMPNLKGAEEEPEEQAAA